MSLRFLTRAVARSLIAILAGAGFILHAASPLGSVEVVTTDRVEFAAGGSIHINASSGELNIEGWDKPQVEITVTRSTWCDDNPEARQKTTTALNLIRVAPQKKGAAELFISTSRRPSFDIHLDYRIMVPHDSRLIVGHRIGDVFVRGVDGGIDASAHMGDILLMLPSATRYSFDVACGLGGIHSDFAGVEHRAHLAGERLSADAGAPSHRIRVRVGIGGIEIQKDDPNGVISPN